MKVLDETTQLGVATTRMFFNSQIFDFGLNFVQSVILYSAQAHDGGEWSVESDGQRGS